MLLSHSWLIKSKTAAIRWNNWKLLTGDPGYPDFPITIPPQGNKKLIFTPENGLQYPIPPRPKPLTRLVRLYDVIKDPTESNDISDYHEDIVEYLLDRLSYWNSTQVPINFPDVDPKSFPEYHQGFWKPWLG